VLLIDPPEPLLEQSVSAMLLPSALSVSELARRGGGTFNFVKSSVASPATCTSGRVR
jgi:hypothetical protein